MAIEFQCPSCTATVRVPDSAAGKKGSCPACKAKLIVPNLEDDAPAPPKSKPTTKSKPAPDKIAPIEEPRPAKSRKPVVEEFDLGLGGPTDAKPASKDKHSEPDFSSLLKIDVGGTSKSAPAPKPAAQPIHIQESPFVESVPLAELDEDIPEFMQQFVPDNDASSSGLVGSVTRRPPQRSGSKAGLIFGLLCGIGLIGSVIYFAMTHDNKLSGERLAYAIERGASLQTITVDNDEIGLSSEVIDNVLKTLKKNPVRIKMESMEFEFGTSRAGMEISLKEGSLTQFFRFPLDKEMKAYRDKHLEALDTDRKKEFSAAIKKFFEKCDVAIRNREGALPLDEKDPRQIGLNSCVRGFGYNIAALIPFERGVMPYPCVYEDEANLYFLLPRNTKQFQVVGKKPDGSASEFPGKYQVKVRQPKTDASEDAEPAKKSKDSEPKEMEAGAVGEMANDKPMKSDGEMKKE